MASKLLENKYVWECKIVMVEILDIISAFVEAVVPIFKPSKIILFGSYAKGNINENSDIDVAVVVREVKESLLESESKLFRIRREISFDIEPILIIENEDNSGFLDHILSYGKVVYECDSLEEVSSFYDWSDDIEDT